MSKTQPVRAVVKLLEAGAVIVTDSSCNNATKPGTSSIVTLFARGLRVMSEALSLRLTRFAQITFQQPDKVQNSNE